MSKVSKLYPSFKKFSHDGTINLATDTFKFALLDNTYNPIPDFQINTAVVLGQYVKPTNFNMHYYKCTTAGTTGGTEPAWVVNGGTNASGTATFTDMGVSLPLASPHTIFADVSASQLPAANGYPSGGKTLTNLSVTTEHWDADDVEFLTLGSPNPVTFMWAVLYKSGTANGITNPLVALYLFDDTPNVGNDNYLETTVTSGEYAAKFDPTAGIIDFQPNNS